MSAEFYGTECQQIRVSARLPFKLKCRLPLCDSFRVGASNGMLCCDMLTMKLQARKNWA